MCIAVAHSNVVHDLTVLCVLLQWLICHNPPESSTNFILCANVLGYVHNIYHQQISLNTPEKVVTFVLNLSYLNYSAVQEKYKNVSPRIVQLFLDYHFQRITIAHPVLAQPANKCALKVVFLKVTFQKF